MLQYIFNSHALVAASAPNLSVSRFFVTLGSANGSLRLRNQFSVPNGIRVFGPKSGRADLVTFEVRDIHAHDLVFFLNSRGIALRAGHHCAQPLMRKLGAPSSSRASFYLYNTQQEVERLLEGVREAVAFFRQ